MYTQNQDEAEKSKQRRTIQMEMIMLESDIRKFSQEKNTLEAELRKLKQDGERIRITLEEKKKRFDHIVQENTVKEEELKRLRKKLNTL